MSELLVRATINLPGLPRGEEVLVDDEDPYMADCLKTGLLVPVEKTPDAGKFSP